MDDAAFPPTLTNVNVWRCFLDFIDYITPATAERLEARFGWKVLTFYHMKRQQGVQHEVIVAEFQTPSESSPRAILKIERIRDKGPTCVSHSNPLRQFLRSVQTKTSTTEDEAQADEIVDSNALMPVAPANAEAGGSNEVRRGKMRQPPEPALDRGAMLDVPESAGSPNRSPNTRKPAFASSLGRAWGSSSAAAHFSSSPFSASSTSTRASSQKPGPALDCVSRAAVDGLSHLGFVDEIPMKGELRLHDLMLLLPIVHSSSPTYTLLDPGENCFYFANIIMRVLSRHLNTPISSTLPTSLNIGNGRLLKGGACQGVTLSGTANEETIATILAQFKAAKKRYEDILAEHAQADQ